MSNKQLQGYIELLNELNISDEYINSDDSGNE